MNVIALAPISWNVAGTSPELLDQALSRIKDYAAPRRKRLLVVETLQDLGYRALEAADGMLLFGISTAFIFTVMQFYYQHLVLQRPGRFS